MRKILFLLMTCSLIQAAQSQKIPFQGKLTENDEPVTGTKNMVFAIQLVGWTETHANVSVLDGFYSVILGSVTPLPENLFAGVDEVSLQITIDGTVLSPVTLYAPIAGGLLLPVELQTTGADTSLVVNLTGEAVGFASALQVNSRTSGLNRAIIARTEEAGSNASSQYAISGRADGPGTGQHIGVLGSAFNTSATGEPRFGLYGQANSLAKYNYGVNGVATGTGNGDEGEGFGVGSINFGLRGYAANNTWNNTGVEAETAGEAGKVSYAVSGLAHAGIGDTVKNYALAGRAYGPGINYGVYGTAWNGTQNWAGWFDGDVNVTGQLMVNGQSILSSDLDNLIINGPASPNFILQSQSWTGNNDLPILQLLGTQQHGDGWYFGHVELRVDQNESGGQSGTIALRGNNGKTNINMGGKQWEENDGVNRGFIHMSGIDEGVRVVLEVNSSEGVDYGHLWLSSADSAYTTVNPYGIEILSASLASNWGSTNRQGALILQDAGNENRAYLTVNDSQGEYYGSLFLNTDVHSGSVEITGDGSIILRDVNGDQSIWMDGAGGAIHATVLNQTSDARLKTNVLPLTNALTNVAKMRGVSYNWIDHKRSERLQIGVIAQEVEEVYPQFVHTDENGMKAVNYAQMVAVLIEAVKELNQKVETLEQQNAALKASLENQESADLAELRAEVESIKKLLLLKAGAENVPTVGGN